jgi:DNA repair exonuclease SbcCD ATPase subunit
MQLIEAELVNVCQHRNITAQFRPFTAVVGPNGSGKSNLVRAVYAALTGDFSRFRGVKAETVCQLAGPEDKSHIRVRAAVGSTEVTVVRKLRPSAHQLVVGGEVLRGEASVNDRLERWFGLPLRVVGDYLFVDQGQLVAIIDATHSKHAQSVQRLFRLDRAETAWQAAGDRLTSLVVPVPDVDVPSLGERISQNSSRLLEAERLLKYLPPADALDDDRLSRRLADCDRALALDAEYKKLADEQVTLKEHMSQARSLFQEVDDDLASLTESADPIEAARVQASMSAWSQIDQFVARRKRLDEQLVVLQCQADVPPDAPGRGFTDLDDKALAELNAECQRLSQFLKTFDSNTGQAECPTCGTETSALQDRHAEYADRYTAALRQCDFLEGVKKRFYDYERRQRDYDAACSKRDAQIVSLKRQMQDIDDQVPEAPGDSLDELLTKRKQLTEAATLLTQLRLEHQQAQKEVTRLETTLSESEKRLTSIVLARRSIPKDLGPPEVARRELMAAQGLRDKRAILNAEISALSRSLADDRAAMEKASVVLGQAGKVVVWKQRLEKVRGALHRDALPKLVAQSYLEQLEESVNEHLQDLGVDFRVRVGDNLSFRAVFPDGRDVPAEVLSGGEKVVFAVAWRLAVNAAFATDVGILCLDEPTDGLDSDRLGCLRRALERLRDLSGSGGLQCVIVTHERSLLPVFDHVIELKGQ